MAQRQAAAGELAELRATVEALASRIMAQDVTIETLALRVSALEATRPRDAEDAALRQQLPASTMDPEAMEPSRFKSIDLLRHAKSDPKLRHALVAAGCTDAGSLGAWLRANRGTRDGVSIQRRGRQWLAMHIEHMKCTAAIDANVCP